MDKTELTARQMDMYEISKVTGAEPAGCIALVKKMRKTSKVMLITAIILSVIWGLPSVAIMLWTIILGKVPILSLFFTLFFFALVWFTKRKLVTEKDADAVIKVLHDEAAKI